jgi:hypothetical protein
MSAANSNYRLHVVAIVSVVSFLVAGMSLAQSPEAYDKVPPGPFQQPTPPWPVEMGFSQDHSSTAYEGARRGDAALIQSLGNYLLSYNQARILWEQARWLNRENNLKQTEALYAQQDMWRNRHVELRKQHEARVTKANAARAAKEGTKYRQAYQPRSGQLNVATGEIGWPAALQVARYQESRERLDELFREHTGYGTPNAATARQIARAVDEMVRTLQDNVATVPRGEYLACQKFLRGLKYEAAGMVEG